MALLKKEVFTGSVPREPKLIGTIPLDKMDKLQGWEEYRTLAHAYMELRQRVHKEKQGIREVLKALLEEQTKVKPWENIDFQVYNKRVQIFIVPAKAKAPRRADTDLDIDFD